MKQFAIFTIVLLVLAMALTTQADKLSMGRILNSGFMKSSAGQQGPPPSQHGPPPPQGGGQGGQQGGQGQGGQN
ncbi:uncharacterized protein LOC108596544 [Drosophila busckii]|uniref:uncharacterized protein LOC108596544 n=1 Tax=Drosophila busckii TaxID=30019 RepID=UPI00083F48C0|nr:uncharacterized protein LOC108596544 [Drosophila busckii]